MKYYRYFCCLLLGISVSAWSAQTPGEKIKQLTAQMEKLSQTLATDRKQHAKSQEELRAQELKLAAINKKIQELDKKIELQLKELKEQETQEQKLNAEIVEQQEHLAASIRSLHATGKQPDLKLLLNQNDTISFQRLLSYYQYFNQALQQQISELDEALGEQNQIKEKIVAAKDELEIEREQQREQQQQLQTEQKERSKLVATLEKSINSNDKELAELQASQKELQKVLAAAHQNTFATTVSGPFSKQQGKLPWPTQGKVIHTFGSTRKGRQKYDGIVISAPEGQAVHAVFAGRVVYADWLRGYGLLVIIDHGNQYMSLYAHNDTLYTRVGDVVKTGQQISTAGTTGGIRQSGLYFEIRQNSKPVNPQIWLKKR